MSNNLQAVGLCFAYVLPTRNPTVISANESLRGGKEDATVLLAGRKEIRETLNNLRLKITPTLVCTETL